MKKQQKHAIMVSALVVLIIAVASGPAHATSLTLIGPSDNNGSFETPPKSSGYADWIGGSRVLDSWTVSSSSPVSLLNDYSPGAGIGPGVASDGHQWIQLATGGFGETFGEISRTFTATVGDTYVLSFDYTLLLNTEHTMTWSIGEHSETFTIPTDSNHETRWNNIAYTYTPLTAGLKTLSFSAPFDTAFYGAGIDNVILTEITPVPEPATFALLLVGGGLMVWRRRNR